MNDTIERSRTPATFVLERPCPVPVEAVWHALWDNDTRDQGFTAGSAFDARQKSHEFRVGGHGTEEGQWPGGARSRVLSTHTDIGGQRPARWTPYIRCAGRHRSPSLT